MNFEVKDKDLGGRIGKLVTRSGIIETPAFFPVVNPVKQQYELPISYLKELGFNQIITNAYIIKRRLGDNVKDVHELLGFNDVIMTDSGAYQLMRYGFKKVQIDPIEIVKFQESIRSDIGVIADVPTGDNATYEEAEYSVKETLRRASLVVDLIAESEVLWVLPIQGGTYLDLVKYSAEVGRNLPYYSIYAVGSPVTLMEKYEYRKVLEMVLIAKKNLPMDKPLHLFGAGHPMLIPFIVALGVDMFDSASYILYAKDGRYLTEYGTYRLEDLDYLPCECPICSKYEARSLYELPVNERIRNLALHNLYVILREIKRVKVAIREGRLWELLEERARTHPSLKSAFKLFTRKDVVKFIEELDPRFKGDIHGIFLYDESSLYRPEVVRHSKALYNYILLSKKHNKAILIPALTSKKPFSESIPYRKVLSRLDIEGADIFFYLPFFTLIPMMIDRTYPYSHFEIPDEVDYGVILALGRRLKVHVRKLLKNYTKLIIVKCRTNFWCSEEFLKHVLRPYMERYHIILSEFSIEDLD